MRKNKRFPFFFATLTLFLLTAPLHSFAQDYLITEYGAVADQQTVNTAAIQKAIDLASKNGGGRVVVPEGTFITGTIYMKENVELHLTENAVLQGSLNYLDYKRTYRWMALIGAKRANNISFTGKGTIDGRGYKLAKIVDSLYYAGEVIDKEYSKHRLRPSERVRPQLLELGKCDGITVKDITLKNSSGMVQAYYDSKNLRIEGVTVDCTAFWNSDGMDIYDCDNVLVKNCNINSSDDGICLKTRGYNGSGSNNITITDCKVRSSASALKLGTTSLGYFKNITYKNIEVYDTFRSAIAIETVDGGNIDNVLFSNINARNTGNAIFMRTGHRKGEKPGSMKNIRIEKVKVQVPTGKPDAGYQTEGPVADGIFNLVPSSIVGLKDSRIENVVLDDVHIIFGGGGNPEVAEVKLTKLKRIPEQRTKYPEFNMFGELPATGFFVRNVNNLRMKNIRIEVEKDDYRPAFVFDKVHEVQLDGCKINPTNKEPQIILSSSSEKISITNVTTSNKIEELIKKVK